MQANVIEYGCDIWIPKWVCVDSLSTVALPNEPAKSVPQYYEKVTGLSQFPLLPEAAMKEDNEDPAMIAKIDEITLQEHLQYEQAA